MLVQSPAPICLFVFNRIDTLRVTVASLLQSSLANTSCIHIFSDGAAKDVDQEKVYAIRKYISKIKGFKSVSIHLAEGNKGLARSIIDGVTEIIDKHEQVIVLEDDLIVSSNFLQFMNMALLEYRTNRNVFSISGYSSPITISDSVDIYFTKRSSSWGWATWKDRWQQIDWDVSDFKEFSKDRRRQHAFNKMGSDLSHMLKKQMCGKIDSWAIRWVYHQYKYDLFTVFPVRSKVINAGFLDSATHTGKNNENRFATSLDLTNKETFNFPRSTSLDPSIIKQFVMPYSITTRVIYKFKKILQF